MKRITGVLIALVAISAPLVAGSHDKPAKNDKTAAGRHIVDAGSFGVFVNGRRIGTEKFRVEQGPISSRATSEVTIDDGNTRAAQSSEWELASNGSLLHYRWHEDSPEKGQTVVEPNSDFIIQRTTLKADDKPVEQPYVLPASTPILDDYFFVHREILLWRYLATICEQGAEGTRCKPAPTQFGVLVPRQHTSMPVQIEARGPEKVAIHGATRDLNRFNLVCDGTEWQLWLDSENKLVRVVVAGMEVVRD
ncbi:MAG TPA: hypothetical protein VE998_03120 [Terriglobales bacterium]|nr:hypothetical protein [Terriglobales bacterium]